MPRTDVTLLRNPNFSLTRKGLCSTCNACMTSMEGFRVLTACRGADDGVAGLTTGTDKVIPTVTPRYAIPAVSGSRDRARHFHLCGCRHSCSSCRLIPPSQLTLKSFVGQGARREPLVCVMECPQGPHWEIAHRAASVRALLTAGAFMTHQSCAT